MLQTNQKITEEYTKLKTPKGTPTSDYIILHQRKGKSWIIDHNITSELLRAVIKGQGQGFHKHDPQQLSKETKGKNSQVLNSLSTNCVHLALATWNLSGNPDNITSTVKRGDHGNSPLKDHCILNLPKKGTCNTDLNVYVLCKCFSLSCLS